jgi:hypothetical protein
MFGYILNLPIGSGTEPLDFRVCIGEYLGFGSGTEPLNFASMLNILI